MSRFYYALKEASRSRQNTNAEGELEPLELNGIDASPMDASPMNEVPMDTAPVDAAPVLNTPAPKHAVETPGLPAEEAWMFASDQQLLDSVAGLQHGPLGTATKASLDLKARLIPHAVDAEVVEHYRRLRTKLIQQQETKPFRSLLVTSPNPQEGKTVTVLNLGLSFAMLPSYTVLVVDGDLRRGSLGKWLGSGDVPGFSNLIDGSAKLEDVVLKCDEIPVHFMVRGNSKIPAAELLNSADLSGYFRRMREHFDMILVDSPPLNLITDTQLLAANCDAVVLIARAFSTTRRSLERAAQDISRFRVIGTILNGGTQAQLHTRYRGYY
jgi:capsular exopolysaccharide synthesis family protein